MISSAAAERAVLEVQDQRGLEWSDEPFGDGAGLLAPGIGGQEQVAADVLDIWMQVHGISMAHT